MKQTDTFKHFRKSVFLLLSLLPFLGLAQSVDVNLSIDNCMNPIPNAGTYTSSGTLNGKTMYVKGANLRIVWTGTQWEIQGDDPGIGGVSWYAGWYNTNNTTTPPADCWASGAGCFLPTLTGPDAYPVVTASSISRADANPTGASTVNYTVTFSGTMNSLTASNFSLTTTGVSGAAISSVSQTSTTVWNVAVGTGTGNGTIKLNLANITGASALICSLPVVGATYTINHNVAPVYVSTSPQTLTVCQNASATDIKSLLHVNDADASQTETWTQQVAPNHGGSLTITSATATSGSTNITPGGTISYTPSGSYTGTESFTIRVSDGTATVDMVVNVTVNALPVATFSYTATPYCANGSNPSPTFSGGGVAGTFSSTTGLVFVSSATGQINLSASTPGSYTVTNTIAAAGGCAQVTATSTITITALPVATFSYSASPYCNNASNPSPTFSGGGVAGTFSSTTGLVFVSTATGQINLSASTAGTYTVTNTIATAGGCAQVTATSSVTIKALPVATFSYSGSPYCSNASNPSPTFSGGGVAGTFSSTTGLVFVSTATGQVNLSASTAGTYTVTNTIIAAGGCAQVTATSSVTIKALPVATFSYSGSPYCSNASNPSPTFSGGGVAGSFSSTVGLTFSNSSTGLVNLAASSAGIYTVTNTIVASGGCAQVTATNNITIKPQPIPTITADSATTFCNGGSVNLNANGGGIGANALQFDGVDDYVVLPSTINSNISNGITLEAWVYIPSGNTHNSDAIISEAFAGDNIVTSAISLGGTNIYAGFYDGFNAGWSQVSAPMIFNAWTHVAYTYDMNTIKLYLNGSLVASAPFFNVLPIGSEQWHIGRRWDSPDYVNGTMKDVRIWNIARTQSNIQNAMLVNIDPSSNGLVASYKLDEGTGLVAHDATFNAYNGTLTNGPTWLTPSTFPATTTTYLWSPNGETTQSINVNTSGSYSVTITNAGCSGNSSATAVIVNPLPIPTITASGTTTFCSGGAVTLNSNTANNSLFFNGGNYVECTSNINATLAGTNNITVEAWINTNSGQNLQTVTGNYGGNMQFLLRLDGMKPVFWVSNGGFANATGATTIPTNTWVHLAGTWDGSTIKVYVNGILDGASAFGGTLPSVSQPVRIGASLLSELFSGSIDEVRIWNVAQTASQIQNNMNNIVPSNSAGLLSYYKLDEGTGTNTADATVNGNDGTLFNGVVWNTPSTSPMVTSTCVWSPNGETTASINVTSAGTYSYTVTNANGCSATSSSISVTVNNPTSGDTTVVACDSYTWNNNTYTSTPAVDPTITLTNAMGCDSVVTLHLTINNSSATTDNKIECDSYTWIDGNTYTSSNNTAIMTYTNASGCDSIVTLNLTINNSNVGDTTVVACDSYTWNSSTYTSTPVTAPTMTLTNATGCDSIVTLHLTINNSSATTDNKTECDTYTWIDGNTYTSNNNTATMTYSNALGCDSIVTLNLTINTIDITVAMQNDTLTSNDASATYQWIDCDNSNAAIAGETNQIFVATQSGNYAVIVTNGACSDTSSCTNVTVTSAKSKSDLANIVVYPNPTSDMVNINVGNQKATITITEVSGKLIETIVSEGTFKFNLSELASGIYFAKVQTAKQSLVYRIVKN